MDIASPTHSDAAENKPIKNLVADACQELHLVPDLAVHLAICDRIAQNPYGNGEAFVKQVCKELDNRKPVVQYLALKLLETLMKNSGPELHRLVANKKLMKLMGELASGKKNSGFMSKFQSDDLDAERKKQEVQDMACVLVKGWAEAFITIQKEVPLFMETYIKLQRDGVRFPQLCEDDCNYATPAPFIPEDTQVQGAAEPYSHPAAQPYSQPVVTGAAVGGAQPPPPPPAPAGAGGMPVLSEAQESADLLKEILGTLEPGSQISEIDFVMEMAMNVRDAQARIQANAEAVNDEQTLMQVIAAVESIDGALDLLARLEAQAPQVPQASQSAREAAIQQQVDAADLDEVQLNQPPPPQMPPPPMLVVEPVAVVEPEDDLMDLLGGMAPPSAAPVMQSTNPPPPQQPPPPQPAVTPQQPAMMVGVQPQAMGSQQGLAPQGGMMGMAQPGMMGVLPQAMGMQPQAMGMMGSQQGGMMGMQPQAMGMQQGGMMGMQPQAMGMQGGMMSMPQPGMMGMQPQQPGMMVPAQQSQGCMMGIQASPAQQGMAMPAQQQQPPPPQPGSQVDINFLSMPSPPVQPPVQQQPPPSFEEAARTQAQPKKGMLPPPPSARPRSLSKSKSAKTPPKAKKTPPKSSAGAKPPAPLAPSDSFEAFFGGQGMGSQENSAFDDFSGTVTPSHSVPNDNLRESDESEGKSLIG